MYNYFSGIDKGVNYLRDAAMINKEDRNNQARNALLGRQMALAENQDTRAGESHAADMDAKELEKQLKGTGVMFKFAKTLAENPSPEMLEGTRDFLLTRFGDAGKEIVSKMPAPGTPPNEVKTWATQTTNMLAGIFGKQQEQLKAMNVPSGGAVYDPNTKKEVYKNTAPEKPENKKTITVSPGQTVIDDSGNKIYTAPPKKKGGTSESMPANVKGAQDLIKSLQGKGPDALTTAIQGLIGASGGDKAGALQEIKNNIPPELKPLYDGAIKILEDYYKVDKSNDPLGIR